LAPNENGSRVCQMTSPAKVRLGCVDRAQQAVEHVVADRVLLGLERHDANVVAQMPHAHGIGLEYRRAVVETLAEHRIREQLAPVDR
jgi:hypothetical protein